MGVIKLNGGQLTIEDVINVAFHGYEVCLTDEAKEKVRKAREIVEDIVEKNKIVYGVTTGFGKFSDINISGEQCKTLQRNLIISHACGTGEKFSKEIVRAIMLLRANALAKGYSGVRLKVLQTLIDMQQQL